MSMTQEQKDAASIRMKRLHAEGKLKRKPVVAKEVVKQVAKKEKKAEPVTNPSAPDPNAIVEFTVNLAANAEVLTINGEQYWHGHTYKVLQSVAWMLNEMAGNTWKHEAQINGESENQYRKPGQYRTFRNRQRLSGR